MLPKPTTAQTLRGVLQELEQWEQRAEHTPTPPTTTAQALTPLVLRRALATRAIIPWYQPKIDTHTGALEGLEALARWPQSDGRMISPAEFVPAIENAGLADELFFCITESVLRDMARWQQTGHPVPVSVNLSMDSALNLKIPEQLHRQVRQYGVAPTHLTIEVTESRLMVERSVALESLTRLSLLGFGLSIDDFGTGYSSLVQLVDLPFNELKIDGSFVRRAEHDVKAQTVLRVATLMGQNLSMRVVAEGVETQAQFERLRQYGCDSVQGYHFGVPMPFDLCTQWLNDHRAPPTPT